MKSFIKKFSFVLAAAMVLTSVAVPASAEAATKGEVTVKGSAVSSKTVWAGGKSVNFDYKYGKKTSGIKGVWTSNNANIVVNPTSGKVTATGKADGTVTFTPDSKKYGKITVAVKARVRATGLFVREDDKNGQVVSEASVKVGETKKFYVSMSTKLHVKSTYFTHVSASTTAASVTNGANGTSYAGANYGRELTVTGLATGTSVINVSATPYTDDRTSNYDPTPVTLTVKVGEEKIDEKFAVGAKQTEAREITATGLATTAGIVLANQDNFNITMPFTVKSSKLEADGTYTAVLETANRLGNNVKYGLYYKDGKEAGAFVAEAEAPRTLVINDGLKLVENKANTAVGTITVKNQWGHDYDYLGAGAPTNIRVNGLTLNKAEYASESPFATDRQAKGIFYYTIGNNAETKAIAVGDTKKITVQAMDNKNVWSAEATKFVTVTGSTKLDSYSVFDYGFTALNSDQLVDKNITDKLTSANVGAYLYKFYLAFPQYKSVNADASDFTVYLDGKTQVDCVKEGEIEANSYNGNDKEQLFSVKLNQKSLSAGTHYFQVVYNGANGAKELAKTLSFTITNNFSVADTHTKRLASDTVASLATTDNSTAKASTNGWGSTTAGVGVVATVQLSDATEVIGSVDVKWTPSVASTISDGDIDEIANFVGANGWAGVIKNNILTVSKGGDTYTLSFGATSASANSKLEVTSTYKAHEVKDSVEATLAVGSSYSKSVKTAYKADQTIDFNLKDDDNNNTKSVIRVVTTANKAFGGNSANDVLIYYTDMNNVSSQVVTTGAGAWTTVDGKYTISTGTGTPAQTITVTRN